MSETPITLTSVLAKMTSTVDDRSISESGWERRVRMDIIGTCTQPTACPVSQWVSVEQIEGLTPEPPTFRESRSVTTVRRSWCALLKYRSYRVSTFRTRRHTRRPFRD